mgnify:CR=1 FL=1
MKLNPIVTSLLETDAYKFSMGNVIFKQFNNYTTTWTFKCRNEDVKFTDEMVQEIREQFDYYCDLKFTNEELDWLKTNSPWLSDGYINYLKFWHPVREEVFINENNIVPYNDCGLAIEAKGTWLNTSMYEIAILQIVNEVYFSFMYDIEEKETVFRKNTERKLKDLGSCKYQLGKFSEFGLRRRLSKDSQEWLIQQLVNYQACGFVGTSNVYLAKKYGVKATGTQAHEFIQAVGQGNPKHDKSYSNYFSMKSWTDEYKTLNGIYLTDCITTDCFLKDFDLTFATLFSGVRHDSGDPIEWGEKIINHYKKLNIDPKTKTLLFSDSLNFEKASYIYNYFKDKCNVAFGIGTFLSNDTDVKPLNIVMKITECNGSPVAKISDTQGKGMCRDNEYVDYLTRCIKWRMDHE